jgi:hypothetical protein
MRTIEADYLVVGAGAMGMAFIDTLVSETEASVVVVDRQHAPGGHWTMAYPFVRLHQPSAFYGVNSSRLGSDTVDQVGWNRGLYELATAGEICAYYDRIMRREWLPTGRVSYFPMSEYLGDGRFRTLAGADHTVRVRRRVVDGTYMRVMVPAMRRAPYEVADGVDCVPPNDLPRRGAHRRYVVVGAGKTGSDTCLWLLGHGVGPDRLTWIMPRDSWLLDRETMQPGWLFADKLKAGFAAQLRAIKDAASAQDLLARLEDAGLLMRIDPAIRPAMYRCATVTRLELEQLRRITDVVRMGHLLAIDSDRMVLDGGTRAVSGDELFIDCTADGAEKRPATPNFRHGKDHAAKRARLPADLQRRADRPRRSRISRRRRQKSAMRAPAASGHRPRLVAARAGRLHQSTALVRRPGADVVVVRGAPGPVRSSDRPPAAVGVGETPRARADTEHRQVGVLGQRRQARTAPDRAGRTGCALTRVTRVDIHR